MPNGVLLADELVIGLNGYFSVAIRYEETYGAGLQTELIKSKEIAKHRILQLVVKYNITECQIICKKQYKNEVRSMIYELESERRCKVLEEPCKTGKVWTLQF
ncbi:MAG: hypothetical protein A3A98_03575 [Candidatus Staskawiczbacteria bacterium RIFCSPLOWO2_01_FULL_40_39]|uniref:Uncharacterized protein n=1 Tax=Candidatus Staskawiczbacteria bacterium RIFCSPHIGHO2_01_FULL_39_25 TaxID=1802202 RepID=A0A1G2HQ04_9BACT|nr:MAG: hypothetical protein A2730_02845 [Candidatus Staskawiczbacteria bacterium RIFCSPHIGHO2_01_FULL_39_25]OGZ72891.1 MAG: hypothetical protein A3A98_03575 [Candidatus Staskawiczbacteria bacterium RIFCSPLOWO2_01_FULL_40_39]